MLSKLRQHIPRKLKELFLHPVNQALRMEFSKTRYSISVEDLSLFDVGGQFHIVACLVRTFKICMRRLFWGTGENNNYQKQVNSLCKTVKTVILIDV